MSSVISPDPESESVFADELQDDDGLQTYNNIESDDILWIDTDDEDEKPPSQFDHYDIDHSQADYKLRAEDLIADVENADFNATEAFNMLHKRWSIDYGEKKSGSKPASADDKYYPQFFLDMITVVGRPMHPITHRGAFFDNVTFSLEHWHLPYVAKYIVDSLHFELRGRTFRLAKGGRDTWFIVMHPIRSVITELPPPGRAERQRRKKAAGLGSAMQRHRAEALAGYIKTLFLAGDLVGEGVEASWKLHGRRSADISFGKWLAFQTLFMDGWAEFSARHASDPFWTDNEPAFHTHDHGGNIEILTDERFENMPRETPLTDEESDAGDGGDGNRDGDEDEDEDEDRPDRHRHGPRRQDQPPPQPQADLYEGGLEDLRLSLERKYSLDHIELISYALATNINCDANTDTETAESIDLHRGGGDEDGEDGDDGEEDILADFSEASPPYDSSERSDSFMAGEVSPRDEQDSFMAGSPGSRDEQGSFMAGSPGSEDRQDSFMAGEMSPSRLENNMPFIDRQARQVEHALCLLADRDSVLQQYASPRDITFFPLAFNPKYGNFSSRRPPAFMEDQYTVLSGNMSRRNRGAEGILRFGFFQGYSNLKRTFRNQPDDLLATKGLATAALTLPRAVAKQNTHVRTRHQANLQKFRGQSTPDDPSASRPFSREGQRVQAAMDADAFAFRMEQVVTVRTSLLERPQRHFYSVLQPIFQMIRFFLREEGTYSSVLRAFPPRIFPNILCAYARVVELCTSDMDRRYSRTGDQGLTTALAEGTALLDRLGHYCFTGDPRVLPKVILNHLCTIQSLKSGAWPFVDHRILDLRPSHGKINMTRWPRSPNNQPELLHIAALAFHYGPVVATSRQSQIWFSDDLGVGISNLKKAMHFLEKLFRNVWVPEMVLFMSYQLRRGLYRVGRGEAEMSSRSRQLKKANEALDRWEDCEEPFSTSECRRLFPVPGFDAVEGPSQTTIARMDFVQGLYDACVDPKATGSAGHASMNATWFPFLRGAIQNTPSTRVTGEEWRRALAAVLLDLKIDWVPGTSRKKLSSRVVVMLVGQVKTKTIIQAREGSLKRACLEAGLEMSQPKRARVAAAIDFRSPVPFTEIPRIVREGFKQLDKTFESGNRGVFHHYRLAQRRLSDWLGHPLCDLMLMLTLTLSASTVTPYVRENVQPDDDARFSDAPKRKDPAMLAANMVTRMLWFLDPDSFPWTKDQDGVLRISEMTKKMEHKGVNNRVLRELGWIQVQGNRDNPRNSQSKLMDDLFLVRRRELLIKKMDKADQFISDVFQSRDSIWVDRCISIIGAPVPS